jgi:2-keto-3-deoxy-L-arabinonate dehydratase
MTTTPSGWNGSVHGIIPVIPTPFGADEEIDFDAFRQLIEFAVRSNVAAVCLPAYGSEYYKLSGAERLQLVRTAVQQANGRVGIIAQSNHPSSKLAAGIARRNQDLGADVISFALPRQFALTEEDELRYAERVAGAVSKPVLIQDFNPGGPTIGAAFARRLRESTPNLRYLKLEEPLMGAKVRAIREATRDEVGVLEGWGGMHLLELLPAGITGAMPGLGACDLLQRVIERFQAGELDGAARLFRQVLPHILYSLQNMELFHHAEKRLLVKRGILRSAAVREPALHVDETALRYMDFTQSFILQALVAEDSATAST